MWPLRLLKGSIAFLTLCVIAAGGGYLYLRHQLGRINRLSIPGLDESGDVMNVLLVGSDSRANVTGDLAETTGAGLVSGQRSDTIMVLHVDPKNSKAAIFSIPRDLYVPISGTDYSDRVNTAFSVSGAAGLIATIEESLGFQINHYVEVDFVGFRDIVNAVDGVKVYFPSPVRDEVAGLSIDDPGCVKLDGDAGLAFVRSRNFETYEGGEWAIDPTADLGRIQRQQDFIRRMLRKAVSSGLSNPLTLNRLIGIGVRDVTLDDQMSTGDIVRLARRFKSLDADTVDMVTFPTTPEDIGGASVLVLKQEEAQPYIDRLNGLGGPERVGLRLGAAVRHPGARPQRLRRRRRGQRGRLGPHRGGVQRGRPGRRRLLQLHRHRDPLRPRRRCQGRPAQRVRRRRCGHRGGLVAAHGRRDAGARLRLHRPGERARRRYDDAAHHRGQRPTTRRRRRAQPPAPRADAPGPPRSPPRVAPRLPQGRETG